MGWLTEKMKREYDKAKLRSKGMEHVPSRSGEGPGYWRKGPKVHEQEAYQKYKEDYMLKAADFRGRERAKRDADKYRKRPYGFAESIDRGITGFRKNPMFKQHKGSASRSAGVRFNEDIFSNPWENRKKLKIRRPI